HKSYLLTAHSKALSDVNLAAEPPDGAFVQKASGRAYRVYRQDGHLRHEEALLTEDGREIGRVDHAIRYLIGSGHFTRSYLVEVAGGLQESPVTWYPSKGLWGMSPGYDVSRHPGFERPVTFGCVRCHAGRAEVAADSINRVAFREKAIGC